ncbi:hypothetical protein JDV02_002711 [Purpureocillium takamizusanense]|uniref:Uncharacterized protein n=1 Tax=Purpureocillium takamizusanense TaxID=2060973 RepID=A0A9Q8QBI9_9HYPO|nr:uncharacterized protein JDV02_002711 [Purpureocillium takamizusanense]UNI16258.1 hypothetical protein JDV02_002711 [Purpureocillium takamizusanense]
MRRPEQCIFWRLIVAWGRWPFGGQESQASDHAEARRLCDQDRKVTFIGWEAVFASRHVVHEHGVGEFVDPAPIYGVRAADCFASLSATGFNAMKGSILHRAPSRCEARGCFFPMVWNRLFVFFLLLFSTLLFSYLSLGFPWALAFVSAEWAFLEVPGVEDEMILTGSHE